MEKTTTIGKYLIDSLQKAGLEDIFGIPGDYVINFFSMLEQSPINIIGTCSEQGAAFAADAYARVNGFGALCITYCVGGLNTINAVAGAYAEKAPLIVISGAPGLAEHNSGYLLHHSVKDLNSQFNIFKEVTVAATQLNDPYTATYEIDRVISACLKHKRPVYIELPRDMIHEECLIPPKKTEVPAVSDKTALEEAIKEAKEMIESSKQVVMLGCMEIKRYNLEKQFKELIDNTGYPYATTIIGKSLIDESHPQYLGVYAGKIGQDNIREYVEKSDCIIMLGTLMADMIMGASEIDKSKVIFATSESLCIKHHNYKNVSLKDFIERLNEELKGKHQDITFNTYKETEYKVNANTSITTSRFFERLNKFLKPDSLVICDVGDCLFGAIDLRLPSNTMFLGPAYYTSMGYGIPACIGANIKNPDVRPIVIVGDGAFQMTGHEISCYVKYGLKPIVFLINNKGYTTQRYLKEGSYNEIQNWNYHLITDLVGDGLGFEVSTEEELEEVLLKAENNNESFTIVNVHLEKYDKSMVLSRMTSFLQKKISAQTSA